jgi:hypothetical protein
MRLMEIRTLCQPEAMANSTKIRFYEWDRETGMADLDDLKAKLDDTFAAVYWESPTYFGTIEGQGADIVKLAHEHGALAINGVDPITLGVLTPPGSLGADIACGDIQPLGMHMHAAAAPELHRLHGGRSSPGVPLELYRSWNHDPGQYAVGALPDRTSYGSRGKKGQVRTASSLDHPPPCTRRSWVAGLQEVARPASHARTTRPSCSARCQACVKLSCSSGSSWTSRHRQDGGRGGELLGHDLRRRDLSADRVAAALTSPVTTRPTSRLASAVRR